MLKMVSRLFTLLVFVLMRVIPESSLAATIDQARPESSEKNLLIEATAGQVWLPEDEVFELGLDVEFFPTKFAHHLSLGLSAEVEFEENNEFYLGPLLSYYQNHYKVFTSAGLQGHDHHWRLKTRLGVGKEFYLTEDLIFVPGAFVDFIDDETHYALNFGFAKEF